MKTCGLKQLGIKRIILFIAALAMAAAGLTACSGVRDDKQFIKNMQTALEKRWDASDASGEKQFDSDKAYKDSMKGLIDIELKALGEYDTYTFEDEGIAELAKRYYGALDSQAEGIKSYGVSDADYYELYNKGYNERTNVVYTLNKDYELKVAGKYDSIMDEFCVMGKKMEDVKLATESLTKDAYELSFAGSNTYDINIENTSGFDLENVAVTVNGYNGDTVVCTGNGFLPKWGNGEKNLLNIYMNKPFEKAAITIEFSDYNGFEGKTEAMELTVKNDLVINIETPKLPLPEIISYSGDDAETKCIIEDIGFEASFRNDGKASGVLKFSGMKSFDEKGMNYSRECRIGWKLYDMDGTVIDSGICFTSDAKMGENFKDCESYISTDLAPGDYRLELIDVQ